MRELLITAFIISVTNLVLSYRVGNDPFRRAEALDPAQKYKLEWKVDWTKSEVTFNVTVETKNFVLFGLSDDGKSSSKADVVVGGVNSDRSTYFTDCHMLVGGSKATLDNKSDWTLISAWENPTHTSISFLRPFDTCDSEDDYLITNSKICLLWAYGNDDNANGTIPTTTRGLSCLYLLDADFSPEIIRDNDGNPTVIPSNSNEPTPKVWSVEVKRTLDERDTAYFCTMHKAPNLGFEHTFIGLDVAYLNEPSKKHIHHMIMLKCNPPFGLPPEGVFEPFLHKPAEVCFTFGIRDLLPMVFCNELYAVWGIGSKAYFLPDDVGAPFGGSETEYFVMQVHYDNANDDAGLEVGIRFDLFYTTVSRQHRSSLMGILSDNPGLPENIQLPPNTSHHTIYGHCSPDCTERMFASSSITIVGVVLHAHDAGRGMLLHHFEDKAELPWIMYDKNYDNKVQAMRHLRNRRVVKPKDQLTIECNYATQGRAVSAGFSTRQEMCMTFIVYYERGPQYSFCTSGINSREDRIRFLGVDECHWEEKHLEWIVDTPTWWKGLKMTEVSERHGNWTQEKREKLKEYQLEHEQLAQCHRDLHARYTLKNIGDRFSFNFPPFGLPTLDQGLIVDTENDFVGKVSYPKFERYVPHPGKICPNLE